MANYISIPLQSVPGIQRDGTKFNSQNYIDGQWTRFFEGKPRKIGGYRVIENGDDSIIRTLFSTDNQNSLIPSINVYEGRANSIGYTTFNMQGSFIGNADRTPVDYLDDYYNINNIWTCDLFTNVSNPLDALIIAHVAPNASNINNSIPGPIYYGDTTGAGATAPLTQIVDESDFPILATGGIIYAAPVLVAYGNNGFIQWSAEGLVNNWPTVNNQVITNKKIIKMIRARGSSAPNLLAFTPTSLLNLTYTTNTTTPQAAFSSVTLEDQMTVISPNSIVQYESQVFWPGLNKFYVFNGIVSNLPNTMSSDFFFNNVNMDYRSKIFGVAVSRYNEIWWFYPKGNATECTNVIIYNVKENTWYDSVISRASATTTGTQVNPIMSDNELVRIVTRDGVLEVYPIWQHEYGTDKVITIDNVSAINSYIETHIFDFFDGNPTSNRLLRSRRIEPDFTQTGNVSVTVNNRMFPSDTIENGNIIQSGPYYFNNDTQKIDDINSQGRLVSFVFGSNEAGGYYQMGKPLLDYNIGDVKPS